MTIAHETSAACSASPRRHGEGVAQLAFFGLFALQHRGQEAAGIAVSDGHRARLHKDAGLVSHVFTHEALAPLTGYHAIGHTRYSTTGSTRRAQRAAVPRRDACTARSPWPTTATSSTPPSCATSCSARLRPHRHQRHRGDDADARRRRRSHVGGAARAHAAGVEGRVLAGGPGRAIGSSPCATRGASGRSASAACPTAGMPSPPRPCALRTLGCVDISEVEPGEIVTLQGAEIHRRRALSAGAAAGAVHVRVRLLLPPRQRVGRPQRPPRAASGSARSSAASAPVDADVVIPVPDSSIPAAIGYARRAGSRYNDGLIKNRYIGRTFIEPTQDSRDRGVALKFNALSENLAGKRVVMIDDSHRARHHRRAAGQAAARGRRAPRCTCASPARRSPTRATSASTWATTTT